MFQFTLTYSDALKIAKKLAHSMSDEETRYYLNGFYVHKTDDKHFAVSTDGHMLTRLDISPQYDKGEFPSVIFPAAAVKQIETFKLSRYEKDNTQVLFSIDGLLYEIECLGQKVGGKLIDGHYPDYTRVIPSGWQTFTNEYGKEGFSPAYFALIMKAASYNPASFKSDSREIRFFFQAGSPGVIQETDPSVLYIIMGKRSEMVDHRHAKPKTVPTEAATAA